MRFNWKNAATTIFAISVVLCVCTVLAFAFIFYLVGLHNPVISSSIILIVFIGVPIILIGIYEGFQERPKR